MVENTYLNSYFLSEASNIEIIEGGCRGVDLIARQYAIDRNLPYKEFPANWEIYGEKGWAYQKSEDGRICRCVDCFLQLYLLSKKDAKR